MINKSKGINSFQKYLTIWVAVCMIGGVLISKFKPGIPEFLSKFEYSNITIPIALLIWV